MLKSLFEKFPGAITVCDKEGIIVLMNDKAVSTFESDGGKDLIGRNVLDCHPEPAKSILNDLMDDQKTNVYTIEKNGVKKLIYQSPWFENESNAGIVELALEIPFDIPHFKRD